MIVKTYTIIDGYLNGLEIEARPGEGIVDISISGGDGEILASFTPLELEELKAALHLAARDAEPFPSPKGAAGRVFITGADYFDDDSLPPLELDLWSGGSGFLEVLNPETLGEFYPVTTTTSQSSLFGDFFD